MGEKDGWSCFYSLGYGDIPSSSIGELFLNLTEPLMVDLSIVGFCSMTFRWLLMIFSYFFRLLIFFYKNEVKLLYSYFLLLKF